MNVLIVAKRSKLECEKLQWSLNQEKILGKYVDEGANVDAILRAHEHQLRVRNLFNIAMPNAHMVMMGDLDGPIQGYDLVIVLGGDNSFTNVSHYVGSIPILGINSDPERSVGWLTQWSIRTEQDVFDLIEVLDFDHLEIEQWARLEVTVNGKLLPPATSEVFLGERQRNFMSRHILEHEGSRFEQKCSGLIVATGAGSTGWYKSAGPEDNQTWPCTEQRARFLATEPYNQAAKNHKMGVIPGTFEDEIVVHSLNDDDGIISIDSWEEFPFSRGATAKIFLGTPLNVAHPVIEVTEKDFVMELDETDIESIIDDYNTGNIQPKK